LEVQALRLAWTVSEKQTNRKRTGGVAQVVDNLPGKRETLSSNPSTDTHTHTRTQINSFYLMTDDRPSVNKTQFPIVSVSNYITCISVETLNHISLTDLIDIEGWRAGE
jgi:hypothetical protein